MLSIRNVTSRIDVPFLTCEVGIFNTYFDSRVLEPLIAVRIVFVQHSSMLRTEAIVQTRFSTHVSVVRYRARHVVDQIMAITNAKILIEKNPINPSIQHIVT